MKKFFVFLVFFLLNLSAVYSKVEESLWVLDSAKGGRVIKLSSDGKEIAVIEGIDPNADIDFDRRDGTVWIIIPTAAQVVKYSQDAKEKLLEINLPFCACTTPRSIALDLKEQALWIASWTQGELIKLSLDGERLLRIQNLGNIYEVVLSPFDGSIWIGDQQAKKLLRFSADGRKLGFTPRRLGLPMHLAINPKDGSLWATFQEPGRVVKFSPEGEILELVEGFQQPEGITINAQDGSVWVGDFSAGELFHISAEGKILGKIGGFRHLRRLSGFDAQNKSFWLADEGKGEIVKISTQGKILKRLAIGEKPIWVQEY